MQEVKEMQKRGRGEAALLEGAFFRWPGVESINRCGIVKMEEKNSILTGWKRVKLS